MIPVEIKSSRKGLGLTVREWNPLIKSGWEAAGRKWHRDILPRHFTREGAARYYYQPRTASYMKRKARQFHHQDPLVFSGRLKREAMRFRDIRVSSKAAKVVIHGPRYLYQFRKRVNEPDKAAELTRLTSSEAAELAAEVDRVIQAGVNAKERSNQIVDVRRGIAAA